ncbi:MAG: DUF1638 domain-containing protein [Deltaproteobacteria bacterium]|jgi:hypothetical protein|nr:DUF1638 domain-containing protein [Deltaproteobacteria bacterium]
MKRTLIACNIFEDEMNDVLGRHKEFDVDTIWIGAGLHNDLNMMEGRLGEALGKVTDGDGGVRIMLGHGCMPGLKELADGKGFPVLPFKNCLGALIGEDRLTELERDRTMVITPAWIRKTWFAEDGIRAMLGWDDTDFRMNFGRYDRLLVLDFGLNPLTDEETLEAFSVIEVPIETEAMDLAHFERFFIGFLS